MFSALFQIAMEFCGVGSVSDLMHVWGIQLTEAHISYLCLGLLHALVYLHGQVSSVPDLDGYGYGVPVVCLSIDRTRFRK